ncbi:MAG: WecB/TagA/CpsF family glycosyltransferase [Candidatus Doudnabacteria bacterium]|nr:WecB/TagA/CpsF family glycosyltransferase [Candidatus Doudnabacteria bacterium]
MKVDIAGVLVDNISKEETLKKIDEFVSSGNPHLIVTTYSEFIVYASRDSSYKKVLNSADLSLPDGIGILWAAKLLKLKVKSEKLKVLECLWQVIYSGASIIFKPSFVRSEIKEQITGSRLIWDIARLASEKGYSISLIGGEDGVGVLAGIELKKKFPELKINLIVSGNTFDDQLAGGIAGSNSDILLIAYSPPKQETWLAQNLSKLNVKVALGLGGTFDYIAKKRPKSPDFMHYMGLEWLWRLITQPWRIKRMWNAIPVFIAIVYSYKVHKVKSL